MIKKGKIIITGRFVLSNQKAQDAGKQKTHVKVFTKCGAKYSSKIHV